MFCLWNFDGRNSWRFYNLYCEMSIFWTYSIAFDILFFRLMLCYYLLHVYNFDTVRVCTVKSLKVWYFIKGLLFLCINFSVILTLNIFFTSFVLQRPRWAFKHCKMDSSFWLFQIFFWRIVWRIVYIFGTYISDFLWFRVGSLEPSDITNNVRAVLLLDKNLEI